MNHPQGSTVMGSVNTSRQRNKLVLLHEYEGCGVGLIHAGGYCVNEYHSWNQLMNGQFTLPIPIRWHSYLQVYWVQANQTCIYRTTVDSQIIEFSQERIISSWFSSKKLSETSEFKKSSRTKDGFN